VHELALHRYLLGRFAQRSQADNAGVLGRVAAAVGGFGLAVAFAAGAPAASAPPGCRLAQLRVMRGPAITPATGQNPLALRFTNRGREACSLKGYPMLAFVDARGVIPFVIRRAGDQEVTTRLPKRVVIAVDRSAFVVVNKYRCDLGGRRLARSLRIGLPQSSDRRAFRLPAYPSMAYCGAGDPGSTVATSPFEPTVRAAMRFR
jgi:hypothetical protein